MNAVQRKKLLKMSARLVKLAEEINDLHTQLSWVPSAKKTKEKFVSVGKGGPALEKRAYRRGWKLFSYTNGKLESGWSGDSQVREYFIKT